MIRRVFTLSRVESSSTITESKDGSGGNKAPLDNKRFSWSLDGSIMSDFESFFF